MTGKIEKYAFGYQNYSIGSLKSAKKGKKKQEEEEENKNLGY